MDYLDVLDEFGKPTGEIKSRTAVHQDGDWHRGSHLWLVNSKNEILIQQRSASRQQWPNLWDKSAAGHVLAGEDALTTIVRETAEEIGINIPSEDFRYLFTVKISENFPNGEVSNEFVEVHFVKGDYHDFVLQAEEVQDAKWVPYLELEKMIAKNPENYNIHSVEANPVFAFLKEELK